jgi:tRNA (guanine-N7-)-methyltransferase
MKKRHRQHINPLKMSSLVARGEPLPLPVGTPIEVELGCGDAHFLISRAIHFPLHFFIGLDIRGPFIEPGLEEISRLALKNIHLVTSNLIVDAPHLFKPETISRFFINFPDPWFKARQKNRRWFNKETLDCLICALIPNGEIFFQTDVWDVSLEALGLLEENDALYNARGEWTFSRSTPFAECSTRELSCNADGRPIWRMLFIRRRTKTS